MSTISVTIEAPGQPAQKTNQALRPRLVQLANAIHGIAGGSPRGRLTKALVGLTSASGTLTLSGTAGAVGGVINGVTITAATGDDDITTAADVAAAINASTNPLVKNQVTATSSGAVVTVTSVYSGLAGNQTTFAASGTGVTASGTRLAGGTAQTGNL